MCLSTQSLKVLLFALWSVICASAIAGEKPNIILIFADDLGYGDLGCYGSKVATPAIDQLASEGVRATDCLVGANVCGPSRAALLTGRYPMRAGHPISRHDTQKYAAYGLDKEEVTLAELLKTVGYTNKMIGKWHLGFHIEGCHPLDAGFDDYFGLRGNYSPNFPEGDVLYRNRKIVENKVKFTDVTRLYTEEAVRFIGEEHKEPFFLYFAHHIPHSPIEPSKPFKRASGKKGGIYGDFVLELDDSVGQVLKAVKEAGIEDTTVVVFLSDNGPAKSGSAKPLSGGKYVTMEGGQRVPAIFRWPGHFPKGRTIDGMITSMDLLPLFTSVAVANLPTDRIIDGKNILPLLEGKTEKSPHQYFHYYNGLNLQAVRNERWKLHFPRTVADQPYWAKKAGGNKKKRFVTLDKPVLYDLDADPGEQKNVIAQHPEVVAELNKEAERVRAEIGDVDVVGSDQRPHHLVDPNIKG